MRTVTVMLEGEALEATLTEEQWTAHSKTEALDAWRLEQWRAAMAQVNRAETPPERPGRSRSAAVAAYGCIGWLVGAVLLFGFVLGRTLGH